MHDLNYCMPDLNYCMPDLNYCGITAELLRNYCGITTELLSNRLNYCMPEKIHRAQTSHRLHFGLEMSLSSKLT